MLKYTQQTSRQQHSRSARSIQNSTMELMVYIDTTLITNRGGNVAATNYALSIMNIVSYSTYIVPETNIMVSRCKKSRNDH